MIKYYDRKKKSYEIEKVAGEKYLNWTYSSPIGMKLLESFIKKKCFSKIYGWYLDRKISKRKIKSFINEFNINMSEFEKKEEDFKTFNEFFYRKLNTKSRPINMNKEVLISPADGKLFSYENIDLENLVQVKGFTYSLRELIKNDTISNMYKGGTCLILRLCPTDYHRFHFIDSGVCSETSKIKGFYYSVNPIAIQNVKKLFCENKREWSLFHSENFGDVLYVEVGATCVGSIVQTFIPNKRVNKGDEKGYFKFGGSTIMLFFEKNKVKIDEDIIYQTKLGFETSVFMGEKIGVAKKLSQNNS